MKDMVCPFAGFWVNLDGLDPSDLSECEVVFSLLAKYSKTKSKAMKDRSSGRLRQAIESESVCERIYSQLPTWAKW